jgi:hypothetical protein
MLFQPIVIKRHDEKANIRCKQDEKIDKYHTGANADGINNVICISSEG